MNILIIGETSRLLPLVRVIPDVEDVHYALKPDTSITADILVLDHIDAAMLQSIHHTHPNKRMVYVYSARGGLNHENYKTMREGCQRRQIPLVTDIADDQLIEELEKCLFPNRMKAKPQPAIALVGCHRRAGKNTFAQSIAEIMAQKITGAVGWIDLDPYALDDHDSGNASIWSLYREYESGVLSPERIRETARRDDEGVYRIVGNAKLDTARQYKPQLLEQVIRMSFQAFDFTVFTVSPYWDNTLTLVPLRLIDRKYLVATSRVEEMQEFYAAKPQINFHTHLDLTGVPFIFNFDGLDNETEKIVSAKLGANAVVTVPNLPRMKVKETDEIREKFEPLADRWITELSLNLRNVTPERQSLIPRWFRRSS
ncbi:hypothetical protein [Paenibacillus tyrfis]|uniref:hypothetical protein n=1 Tax=Paenibacillus tyrfis TaxID=1501230 RepID=UPI000B58FCA0|nr:hypothetical protein [Paenibacillus tyrfis]